MYIEIVYKIIISCQKVTILKLQNSSQSHEILNRTRFANVSANDTAKQEMAKPRTRPSRYKEEVFKG